MHFPRIKFQSEPALKFSETLLIPFFFLFFCLCSLSAAAEPGRMTGGLFGCCLTSAYNNSCWKCTIAILGREYFFMSVPSLFIGLFTHKNTANSQTKAYCCCCLHPSWHSCCCCPCVGWTHGLCAPHASSWDRSPFIVQMLKCPDASVTRCSWHQAIGVFG